jgi:hypothetical protein
MRLFRRVKKMIQKLVPEPLRSLLLWFNIYEEDTKQISTVRTGKLVVILVKIYVNQNEHTLINRTKDKAEKLAGKLNLIVKIIQSYIWNCKSRCCCKLLLRSKSL